jgi:hypothetical protein
MTRWGATPVISIGTGVQHGVEYGVQAAVSLDSGPILPQDEGERLASGFWLLASGGVHTAWAIIRHTAIFSIQREEPCSIRGINGIHAVHGISMPDNVSGIKTITRRQVLILLRDAPHSPCNHTTFLGILRRMYSPCGRYCTPYFCMYGCMDVFMLYDCISNVIISYRTHASRRSMIQYIKYRIAS